MWKSNDKVTTLGLLKKKGLSLVELIVVTVVIAIAATLAFPTYTIFQQRSKEQRLKKILTDVRTAINGSKSNNSTNSFEEGFRTVARVRGLANIEEYAGVHGWDSLPNGSIIRENCVGIFISMFSKGYGYPKSPDDIWSPTPKADFPNAISNFNPDDPSEVLVLDETDFNLGRPFYRSKPVHPFHDWYPTADFKYVPATDTNPLPLGEYTYEQWYSSEYNPGLRGVKDIVSRGVGMALDGSNTDDW